MHRRDLLKASVTGAAVYVLHLTRAFAEGTSALPESFAALEHRHGGRLGVAVLDTETGHRFAHRGNQRFLMCSTFKVLLVAAVLARVDHGKARLEQRIVFDKSALLDWAPVTKQPSPVRRGVNPRRLEIDYRPPLAHRPVRLCTP